MYGFVVTTAGQGMLARAAAGEALTITSVQVGKGVVGSQAAALALTALVDPVANATSDEPEVNGNQMSLIVEYRNDLNGGLQEGFELSEFGIFASVGDDQPALLYYASLGDNPQPVQPESAGLDVHRFPVAIAVTGDISVALNYPDNAFVANKDFDAHVSNTSNPHGVKAGQVMTESGESVEAALSNKAEINEVLCQRPIGGDALNAIYPYLYTTVVGPGTFGPRSDYWYVEYYPFDEIAGIQVITSPTGQDRWYRTFDGGAPNNWKKIATATPPQEYDLPLAEGVEIYADNVANYYCKNEFGEVSINTTLKIGIPLVSGMTIATIPQGFTRHNVISFPLVGYYRQNNNVFNGNITIEQSGAICLWVKNLDQTNIGASWVCIPSVVFISES